jgi:hypothetical protein
MIVGPAGDQAIVAAAGQVEHLVGITVKLVASGVARDEPVTAAAREQVACAALQGVVVAGAATNLVVAPAPDAQHVAVAGQIVDGMPAADEEVVG